MTCYKKLSASSRLICPIEILTSYQVFNLFYNFQFLENGAVGESGLSATRNVVMVSRPGRGPVTPLNLSMVDLDVMDRLCTLNHVAACVHLWMENGQVGQPGQLAALTVSSSEEGHVQILPQPMVDFTARERIS